MNTALQFLTHRLEWPVCRVRREAAHELAALIRDGVDGAADALLGWIDARELESEAAVGVSIIHAFDLGRYIPLEAVTAAVRAPSFLSDLLLQATYPSTPDSSARYGYAQQEESAATETRSYFERNQGQLIALRFRTRLGRLERESGLPFFDRWFEEWSVLRDRYDVPFSERPDYVWSGAPREDTANVQVRQTEVYISAYLRTLAYAVAKWKMPPRFAISASLEALPFCGGLATVRPIERPKWSFKSLEASRAGGVRLAAAKAWRAAARSVPAGQNLLSLRTTDYDDKGVLRLTLRRVLIASVHGERPPPDQNKLSAPWAVVDAQLAMTGPLTIAADQDLSGGMFLSANVLPGTPPRLQTEFLPDGIELAHPELFSGTPVVSSATNSLRLEAGGKVVSEWKHWYADWQAAHPKTISGYSGYSTTIDARELARIARRSALVLETLCQADYGVREYSYEAATFEAEQFWL